MGDGEHLAAGLLPRGSPATSRGPRGLSLPERLHRGVRLDQAGLGAVVAEDDVAVQVVAAGVGGPLVADERGEAARIVGLFGGLDRLLPGRAVGGVPGRGEDQPSWALPRS